MVLQLVRALAPSSTGRRLLESTFWSAVAESLSRGLLLLALVFVARYLGAEQYGAFGIIRSTINVLATLGGMGLGLTANRYVAEYRSRDRVHAGRIIGSSYILAVGAGLFVGLIVLAGAETLAVDILRAPQLRQGLNIAAALLLLGSVQGAQIGILQGLGAFRRIAISSAVQGIAALTALVTGARYFGLEGALLGLLAYNLAGMAIFFASIRAELRLQQIEVDYGSFRATLPIFWKFSLPVMLAGVAVAPVKWLAETMLVTRIGFTELGFFHASLTIATMLIAGVSTLNAPLISLAASRAGTESTTRTTYVNLYGTYYVFLAIALPLVMFPRIASLAFGAEFATNQFYSVVVLLLLYVALMTYYNGILRLLAIDGSMWFGFITNLFEGAALIVGFLLLLEHGALGLGIAYVFSYVVRIVVSLPWLLRRGIVPHDLLRDRYFLLSMTGFVVLAVARVLSLQ